MSKFFVQGFTFGSVNVLGKFLDQNSSELKLKQSFNQKYCQKLSARIKHITKSDISVAIMHSDKLEVTTYIAITDDSKSFSQRYIFTFHPAMNIQRVTAIALRLLYQYLTQQKMS